MLTKTIKRRSMLAHWTFRYVIILCIGLLLIGVLSYLWVQHSTIKNRLELMQLLAQELGERVTSKEGTFQIPDEFTETIYSRQRFYHIPDQVSVLIKTDANKVIFSMKKGPQVLTPKVEKPLAENPENGGSAASIPPVREPADGKPPGAPPPAPPDAPPEGYTSPAINNSTESDPITAQYSSTAPILFQGKAMGTVTISQSKKSISKIQQESSLLALLLGGIGLLGWLVIYLILRKLTRPIRDIALAAKKIAAGDYRIELQENVKEKEIYELLVSFRGMSARLEQLEELRTELLAGVTHELKTPIASINGLIHAVRDQIVTGAEAEEFLDISLKETERLQLMVIGLLDFNSFASGKIHVERENLELGKLLKEITYQWSLLDSDDSLEIITELPPLELYAFGDPSRIQQIIVNLLNNSRQAITVKAQAQGQIKVRLFAASGTFLAIHVMDNGAGIPLEEQNNIFERYFRGGNKKLAVHGLGLGLTFSSMLAIAMGCKLSLVESSPEGTTFELLLPRL